MSNFLCRNLKLTIERIGEGEQIRLSLRDDLNLSEVSLWYGVSQPLQTGNRRYYMREAMVIAMRNLVSKAIEEGLISDAPGAYTTLSSGTGAVTPSGPPTTFTIGEESL